MPKINSLNQIDEVLLPIIADALNEVAERAVELMKVHVDKDVYAVGDANRTYYHDGTGSPTYQLRDSIIHTEPAIQGKEVTAVVKHDTNLMQSDPDTFLHGSNYFSPQDVRSLLPTIINEGLSGPLFGAFWHKLKRPYFTNTKEELEKGLFQQWMAEALRKRGVRANVVSTIEQR